MSIFREIEHQIGEPLLRHEPVSGGDINHAFRVETARGVHFLKFNTDVQAKPLLAAERRGLERLRRAGTLAVPEVIVHGHTNLGSYLLLEWIEVGPTTDAAELAFGTGLAKLHQITQAHYGGTPDNFIGALPQSNGTLANWTDFYAAERILPQFQLAMDKGLLNAKYRRQVEHLLNRLDEICPNEPATLTHGDLWSGNWLVDAAERPWLIDPAVSFQHREMDLGMLTLFGQPGEAFWEGYQAEHLTAMGLEERLPVYQLYYLLVHVNLFGRSYVPAVIRVLERFGR